MKIKKIIAPSKSFSLAICLTMFLVTPVLPSSLFSRHGIGLYRYYTTIQSVGMGGAGIASLSRSALQYMNPAALSFLNITRFDGSLLIENIRVKMPSQSGKFANSNFNSVQIAVPIKTGYAIGFGLQPYSLVSFELSGRVDTPDFLAEQTLTGKGSLTRGFFRLGGRLGDHLAYGFGMDVYFGRIERIWRVNFESSGFQNTRDIVSSYIRGLSGHLGLVVQISQKIDAGAVLYFPATLKYTTDISLIFGPRTDLSDGHVKIPLSQGYGISYYLSNKIRMAADIFLQSWGNVSAKDIFNARTTNSFIGAVGMEFTPTTDQTEGLFRRMSYRIGFRTTKLPYLDDNGTEIQENVFSFGFTLPYYFYRSKIDLGIEIGKRGSLSKNTAEEKVFRMVVGVTSGEKWFGR